MDNIEDDSAAFKGDETPNPIQELNQNMRLLQKMLTDVVSLLLKLLEDKKYAAIRERERRW